MQKLYDKTLLASDRIDKLFKQLSKLTTDNDYVLIYYSGHGESRGVNNYWIPVDAEKEFGLGDWINTSEIAMEIPLFVAYLNPKSFKSSRNLTVF